MEEEVYRCRLLAELECATTIENSSAWAQSHQIPNNKLNNILNILAQEDIVVLKENIVRWCSSSRRALDTVW
jgi:hypothetical protein